MKNRIRAIKTVLDKCEAVDDVVCEIRGREVAYECFGRLLHSYCHGWECSSKIRLFELVAAKTKLREIALQVKFCCIRVLLFCEAVHLLVLLLFKLDV
jgi:hypothetical protein